MGTVLSLNPKEHHNALYSTQRHLPYNAQGELRHDHFNSHLNFSNESQFNNYSYEQLNNAKNREIKVVHCSKYSKNENCNHLVDKSNIKFNYINTNNNNNNNIHHINNTTNRTIIHNKDFEPHYDNLTTLSEKTTIEKHFKKHSLFINALSWKRITSHTKKKVENKAKTSNLPTINLKQTQQSTVPTTIISATTTTTITANVLGGSTCTLNSSFIDKNKNSLQSLGDLKLYANTVANESTVTAKISTATAKISSATNCIDLANKLNNTNNSVPLHNKLVQKQLLALSLPAQFQAKTNNNLAPRKTVIQVYEIFKFR